VLGWAHEALAKADAGLVPAQTMEQLRNNRISHTVKSARAKADLSAILSAFSGAGVRHMVLKGPLLAELVYPRPDLRYYTDIDLLVREEDIGLADRELSRLGYMLVGSTSDSIFDQGKTQAHYYREGSLPIDLHWQLINLPSHESSITIDMNDIWEAAVPVDLAGEATLSLSPEDMLLFQCAHMTAHHDFNRLLWFKDVEQVTRRYAGAIDWESFVERVDRYRLRTFVYYSLVMSASLCGRLPVPEQVLGRLRPKYLMARLFERLVKRTNILELQVNRRRPALEVWRLMRDERGKRYGAMAKRSFPAVDWYLECYPFLPKIRHQRLYYGAYPVLMGLRLLKRPTGLDLSETQKSR
jgi:hypothetical protein